jgi:hypothetical protein
MALSVKQLPTGNTYLPAHNDNIFVVSESSTAVTNNFNFKFLCDVKNTSNEVLARLKVPIHYDSTNKGVFNIGQILESFVAYDWDYNDTGAVDCINSRLGYRCSFGYEYSTGATSAIVQTTGVTNLTGMTVYNAAFDPYDFTAYNDDNYLMASGSTANFLTRNLKKRIHINQKEWLYLLGGSNVNNLLVTYSGGGTKVITGIAGVIARFPIGANIPDGLPVGTKWYTIQPRDASNVAVGATYTITIDDRCSKYDNVDLFFLNRLGAVESFRFNKIRRDVFEIERKSYSKNPYTLSNSAVEYKMNRASHSKSSYSTSSKHVIELNSDLITEDESIWLRELVMSPLVWMYDTELTAVNIVDSQYLQKSLVNDKVFSLNLKVEISMLDMSQRL